MKPATSLIVIAFALTATGCIGERTRAMARTCQGLLEQDAQPNARTFIRDAEKQLASLAKPRNKLTAYLRDLQDPEAMAYKPAIEQCLWLLKSRQG